MDKVIRLRIPEHTTFLLNAKQSGGIYDMLYRAGFVSYSHIALIEESYTSRDRNIPLVSKKYFHSSMWKDSINMSPQQLADMHYRNSDGIALAFYVAEASSYKTYNNVIFCMSKEHRNDPKMAEICSYMRRLQRYATKANKALEDFDLNYSKTLVGARTDLKYHSKLMQVDLRKMINSMGYPEIRYTLTNADRDHVVAETQQPNLIDTVSVDIRYPKWTSVRTPPAELIISASNPADEDKLRNWSRLVDIRNIIDKYNAIVESHQKDMMISKLQ